MSGHLEHLGQVIRRVRLQQGLSQTALAQDAELSRNQLVAIENGSRNPSPEALARISDALDLSRLRMSEVQAGLRQDVEYPLDWDLLLPYLRGDTDDPLVSDQERHALTAKVTNSLMWPHRPAGRRPDPSAPRSASSAAASDPAELWRRLAEQSFGSTGDDDTASRLLFRTWLRELYTPRSATRRDERSTLIDRLQTTLLGLSDSDLAKVDAYLDGLLGSRHAARDRAEL